MQWSPGATVYVAGHRGLAGSAIWRELARRGFKRLVGRTRAELDLLDSNRVRQFFFEAKPDFVFLAAAKVGGIQANINEPASFIWENLQIQNHVIHCAHLSGVKKLLFLGSSCIYPKFSPQPMKEEHLLTGPLEPSNEPYAIAKIAGLKLCQAYRRQHGCDFITVMPSNLYGRNDHYDLETSHVLPALIRKFHEAKVHGAPNVVCWGTGQPRREFLFSDDLARAAICLMENDSGADFVNVGCGSDVTVRELAERAREVIGFRGEIVWDSTKPDGTPRKLLDCTRIFQLGWRPHVDLETGLRMAYDDFLTRNPARQG